jgi:hypothetical protein
MDTNQAPQDEQSRRKFSYAFLAIGCILLVVASLVGTSDNPPGFASMFLGAFALILGIVYRFGKSGGRKPGQDLLYWAPRVLCITFAVVMSVFALDVFEEGQSFWRTGLDWLMHLIPNFLILLVLAVSWRREWIGGYLFIVLAGLYVVWAWNKPFGSWSTFLLMAGPLVLTGALFLLNWYYRGALRGSSTERITPRWLLPGIVALGFVVFPVLYFAFLPRTESVTFRIDAPTAQHVFVAGSFNGWNPRQYPLSKQPQGQWQTTISLPLGRHEYKFIVDTEWVHDVNNPNKVELQPPWHGYNSFIVVGSQDSLSFKR